jgi:hypothetical protein
MRVARAATGKVFHLLRNFSQQMEKFPLLPSLQTLQLNISYYYIFILLVYFAFSHHMANVLYLCNSISAHLLQQ